MVIPTISLPPHGGLKAGVVVFGTKKGRALNIERIACPDGFFADDLADITSDASVGLANYEGKHDQDFNLGLTLLKKVLGDKLEAKINGDYKSTTKVNFSKTRENYLSDADMYADGGGLRELNEGCMNVLKKFKASGVYDDRVYLLTNVVYAEVDYIFDPSFTGGSSVSGTPLKEILGAEIGGGWTVTGKTSLNIDKPLYLASKPPVLVKDFLPTGLVSGGFAKVKFVETNIKTITLDLR